MKTVPTTPIARNRRSERLEKKTPPPSSAAPAPARGSSDLKKVEKSASVVPTPLRRSERLSSSGSPSKGSNSKSFGSCSTEEKRKCVKRLRAQEEEEEREEGSEKEERAGSDSKVNKKRLHARVYRASLKSKGGTTLGFNSTLDRSGFGSSKISSKKLRQSRAPADRRLHPPLSHLNRMKRAPIPDDDDDSVARKGKVVTTTEGWPELLRCTTTKPPPILLDELIAEILLRIPARSLVRLRNSVCSSWRTPNSSSQFAKDHLRRSMAVDPALTHPRIAYYCFWHKYPTIGVFSVRSVFENHPRKPTKVVAYEGRHPLMIGSCNGLLCLHDEERAMLWNPCTGFTSQPLEIGGIFYICGFGYDHVNDKYKLFLVEEKKSGGSVTRILTFGPKSTWRTIQDFPYRLDDPNNKVVLMKRVGHFVSGTGTLNWLLFSGLTSFVAVISLDLVKETYSQISLPSRDSDYALSVFPQLATLRGCLAVCYETKKTHWTLWMMKEYGVPQSWTKLAIIPRHRRLLDPPSNRALEPMYMLKNDVLLAKSPNGKFLLCNLNDGSIKFPKIDSSGDGMTKLPPLSRWSGTRIFHIYHESLVSPSHFGLPTCSSEMRLFKPSL